MNRTLFLKEMHAYIDEAYADFNIQQDILKETFKEVHRVCINNGIHYHLSYGSLLGLIRDGDEVIPWDYDFDICVHISEIERLLNALNTDLDSKFYYVSNFNTQGYPYFQIRVTKRGLDSDKSHVDIFYMLDAPNDAKERQRMQADVKKMFRQRANKYAHCSIAADNKAELLLKKTYWKLKNILCPEWFLREKFRRLCKKNLNADNDYFIIFVSSARIIPRDFIVPYRKESLKYSEAFIPNKPEDCLKLCYGDYMSYLPISNRFDEFYEGYKYIMGMGR